LTVATLHNFFSATHGVDETEADRNAQDFVRQHGKVGKVMVVTWEDWMDVYVGKSLLLSAPNSDRLFVTTVLDEWHLKVDDFEAAFSGKAFVDSGSPSVPRGRRQKPSFLRSSVLREMGVVNASPTPTNSSSSPTSWPPMPVVALVADAFKKEETVRRTVSTEKPTSDPSRKATSAAAAAAAASAASRTKRPASKSFNDANVARTALHAGQAVAAAAAAVAAAMAWEQDGDGNEGPPPHTYDDVDDVLTTARLTLRSSVELSSANSSYDELSALADAHTSRTDGSDGSAATAVDAGNPAETVSYAASLGGRTDSPEPASLQHTLEQQYTKLPGITPPASPLTTAPSSRSPTTFMHSPPTAAPIRAHTPGDWQRIADYVADLRQGLVHQRSVLANQQRQLDVQLAHIHELEHYVFSQLSTEQL
jgi:hypothetical protein